MKHEIIFKTESPGQFIKEGFRHHKGGGGHVPPPPKPPPPSAAADNVRKLESFRRSRTSSGFQSTILTGGMGDSNSSSVIKTLLGE